MSRESATILTGRLALAALVFLAPGAGSAVAQEAIFGIEAAAGGLASGPHAFGWAAGALAGLDARDVPEPPHAPSGYLALAFRMLDPAAPLPNRWRDEIRAAADFDDRVEIWELHLESDRLGETCVFAVTPPADPPLDLRLRVIGVGDGEGFVVPPSGVFTLFIGQTDTALWLELISDDPVAAEGATWGAVRRLYAD